MGGSGVIRRWQISGFVGEEANESEGSLVVGSGEVVDVCVTVLDDFGGDEGGDEVEFWVEVEYLGPVLVGCVV